MCNILGRGTCNKMIVKGLEDKLLEYAKKYFNKAYICSCVVQRRTIEFILYSDVEVLDFFSYKFIPYTIVKEGSLSADSFNVKAFSIYLNCAPIDLDCKFAFEDVDIVKNEKDNRKSIQCRKLALKRFNIFIMKKSENIIVFDKESNSFLITGSSLISQLEDIRVLIRDIEGTLNEIVFPLLSSPDNKVNSNKIIHNNIINYDDICRREWSGAININSNLYKINMENLKKRLVDYSKKIFVFREKDNYLYYRKE